jgi:FAD/FMN-containing dehydrogenase
MTAERFAPGRDFTGVFRDDVAARAVYAEAAGIGRVMPRAVAVPASVDDVVHLVKRARAENVSLVPRASGSSMPNGAIGRGVIVDMSRLHDIGAPDHAARSIAVGPGAVRDRVDARAHTVGLRFPVDPSSGAFCTIGGMVSTNAAGARTLRFGSTRPWVRSLDCVFADGARAIVRRGAPVPRVEAVDRFLDDVSSDIRRAGTSITSRQLRKNSSGYALSEYAESGELVDLLVGSEGTLAFIVGVELGLTEVPGATASLLASYATLDAAVIGAADASEHGASACELLDRTFLDVAARGSPLSVPAGTEAVLLIELEARTARDAEDAARALASSLRLESTSIAIGLDHDDEERLWALRHAASPILSRLDPSLKSMQFIEDGVVPPAKLADYVRGVRAALSAHDTSGVIFGHAGDAHVHVNPLIDVRREGWRERVAGVLSDVVDLTARLGGSLSGEHGDGSLRAPLLNRTMNPNALELARRVKRAFDPDGVLNPGVKVPLPDQPAIGDIKYDPMLPPPPPAAARVLERVERDRAYAEFRLSMLDEEERRAPAPSYQPS